MKEQQCLLALGIYAVTAFLMMVCQANAQTYVFTTLPEGQSSFDSSEYDGIGSHARFLSPTGITFDSSGNLLVTDNGSDSKTVRKLTLVGTDWVVSTIFQGPYPSQGGAVADGSGNIYVAYSSHVIGLIAPNGTVTFIAGKPGLYGPADGTNSGARFYYPWGLSLDGAGNLYVGDSFNRTIRKVEHQGTNWIVTTLAGFAGGTGTNDGIGPTARFNFPRGLALDSATNIYVADSANHTIRKVTPGGVVTTLAGLGGQAGSADGTGSAARFSSPNWLTVDTNGNVFVADGGSGTNGYTVRIITPLGVTTTLAGRPGVAGDSDGSGTNALFGQPGGMVVDRTGTVYLADNYNNQGTIRRISGNAVSTIAGQYSAPPARVLFSGPNSVALDMARNVYVAAESGNTIEKITPAGEVSTLAGLSLTAGSDDGTGSAARFNRPEGIAVDGSGNIYVADQFNHTIRMVTPAGVVTTLAGQALSAGSTDGTNSEARFNNPSDVAVNSAGNLIYVTDSMSHTIRKMALSGANWVVTTFAGLAGASGTNDGTGSSARFAVPYDLALNASGTLYVADTSNQTIRVITPAGVVTTLAGQPGAIGTADGTGNNARFNYPNGLAVDGAGNIYVADSVSARIRRVTPAGVVTTLAGGGPGVGVYADGTGNAALFSFPYDVAVDEATNLYVADWGNSLVRKGYPISSLPSVTLQGPNLIDRQFRFGILWTSGLSNLPVYVETSTNFATWPSLGLYPMINGSNYFVGNAYSPTNHFYRARVP